MSCANCVTGTLHEGNPIGKEDVMAGLSCYTSGVPTSNKIIVFGTDIFGWTLRNSRLLADQYAQRGYYVIMPDLFDGYRFPQWAISAVDPGNKQKTWFQKYIAVPWGILTLFIPFALRHSFASQASKIINLTNAIRDAHPRAKLGFVGFCWGGKFSLICNSLFDATVAAHPSRISLPKDIYDITKPIAFLLAEHDHRFGPKQGTEVEMLLKRLDKEHEVVVYDGMEHGFACRGDPNDPVQKTAMERARDQTIAWFDRFLS